jgi:enolase-phosphatase E1
VKASVVLLDVEGTTTPVTFVYDVLFPYARRHVRAFLDGAAEEAGVRSDLALLRHEHAADVHAGSDPPPWSDSSPQARIEDAVAYVQWLMDRDRKSTGLKSLQGRIWEDGYRRGALRGQVYDDVPRALRRWRAAGLRTCIFSSGSVLAQQLLFRHSEAGDLTSWLDGHFDTAIGPKKEAASYRRIAAELGVAAPQVRFVSDVVDELDAAREASLETRHCVRPGTARPDRPRHPILETFDALD